MAFKTDLKLRSIRGTEFYKLTDDLVYEYVKSETESDTIIAAEGTETNFASVPNMVKAFIDNDDPQIRDIAVIHDDLYARLGHHKYTRYESDLVFLAGMKDLKAPWWKRWACFGAVRAFGGAHVAMSMDRRRDGEGLQDTPHRRQEDKL